MSCKLLDTSQELRVFRAKPSAVVSSVKLPNGQLLPSTSNFIIDVKGQDGI